MKGKITIKRNSDNLSLDKSSSIILNTNHILKKHFANFLVTQHDINKLKNKLKQIDPEQILSKIVNQGENVHSIINEFYHGIIEKLDVISEQISCISDCVNLLQELNYSNSNNKDRTNTSTSENAFNTKDSGKNKKSVSGNKSVKGDVGSYISLMNNVDDRPLSMKISSKHFYQEKLNKLKKLESDFLSKSKEMQIKNAQYHEDDKFLDQITKEREILVDSLSEDFLRRVGESYTHDNQIMTMKMVLMTFFKVNITPLQNEKEIQELFKVRILFI